MPSCKWSFSNPDARNDRETTRESNERETNVRRDESESETNAKNERKTTGTSASDSNTRQNEANRAAERETEAANPRRDRTNDAAEKVKLRRHLLSESASLVGHRGEFRLSWSRLLTVRSLAGRIDALQRTEKKDRISNLRVRSKQKRLT